MIVFRPWRRTSARSILFLRPYPCLSVPGIFFLPHWEYARQEYARLEHGGEKGIHPRHPHGQWSRKW